MNAPTYTTFQKMIKIFFSIERWKFCPPASSPLFVFINTFQKRNVDGICLVYLHILEMSILTELKPLKALSRQMLVYIGKSCTFRVGIGNGKGAAPFPLNSDFFFFFGGIFFGSPQRKKSQ